MESTRSFTETQLWRRHHQNEVAPFHMANRQEQYNTYSHHPEPNRVNNVGFHYAPSPYEGGPSPISTGHYDSPSCEDGPSPMSTGREDGGDLFLNSASPASSSQSPMLANGGLATQNLQGAMTPAIVGEGLFDLNSNTIPYYNDFHDNPLFNDFHDHPLFPSSECHNPNGYVDQSRIHAEPLMVAPCNANYGLPTSTFASSQAAPVQSPPFQPNTPSPFGPPASPMFPSGPLAQERRGSNGNNRAQCTHEGCGKWFKDIKSHMLTHQDERPFKCDIKACQWSTRGFSRKYDRDRHSLIHYKGDMTCAFCTDVKKPFNRLDVFKRHLENVHHVDPKARGPKSQQKSQSVPSDGPVDLDPGYAPGVTGRCVLCLGYFRNAQSFFGHLDACVLQRVHKEQPAEAINATNLAQVETDPETLATLRRNHVPNTNEPDTMNEELDAEGEDELNVGFCTLNDPTTFTEAELKSIAVKTSTALTKTNANPANGVQKSRGMTHSRGGVSPSNIHKKKSAKNRPEFPDSWGLDPQLVTTKKRVLACFDGPRRLAKDEMMLPKEHQVIITYEGGETTDLDVQSLRRAQAFHEMDQAEKGPWVSDDPTPEEYSAMQQEASFAETANGPSSFEDYSAMQQGPFDEMANGASPLDDYTTIQQGALDGLAPANLGADAFFPGGY